MSDQFADYWASRAKTPQTRARIRRLSRLGNISIGILLTGIGLFGLMILVSIALCIWFWIDDISCPGIFIWGFGITMGVTAIGGVLNVIADWRLAEAKFADGHCSVGVVDSVIVLEGAEGDGFSTTLYTLAVRAALPNEVMIRRHIDWGAGDSRGPDETWIGRRILFRHNSLDPDDLWDVRFEGWSDRKAARP